MCEIAVQLRIHLLIGSLALKTHDNEGRFANRSFLIGPDGKYLARHDEIHMFDAAISETETWAESDGYQAGTSAILAKTSEASIGMAACYDTGFPDCRMRWSRREPTSAPVSGGVFAGNRCGPLAQHAARPRD